MPNLARLEISCTKFNQCLSMNNSAQKTRKGPMGYLGGCVLRGFKGDADLLANSAKEGQGACEMTSSCLERSHTFSFECGIGAVTVLPYGLALTTLHHHPSAPLAGMFSTTVFQRSRSSIALPRSSGSMPVSLDNI